MTSEELICNFVWVLSFSSFYWQKTDKHDILMTKVRNLVMLISLCLSEFRVYKYHLHATLLDTQDFTNPDVLKTRRTLTGLSLWFCLHKCFWRTLRYDNSRRRKWIPRKCGKFIKSQFKILTWVVLRGWLNMRVEENQQGQYDERNLSRGNMYWEPKRRSPKSTAKLIITTCIAFS